MTDVRVSGAYLVTDAAAALAVVSGVSLVTDAAAGQVNVSGIFLVADYGNPPPETQVSGLYLIVDAEREAPDTHISATFNVALQYFALPYQLEAAPDLTNFAYPTQERPSGWLVNGDTITPTGDWTNITSLVAHEGRFTHEYDDAGSVGWRVNLRGYNYNATYLAHGCGVCCLRRDWTPEDAGIWRLWWVGVVDAGSHQRDYRNGGEWQRIVRDLRGVLRTTDAPRLTVGTLNMASGGTASASSVLATPALEATEFAGVIVECGADQAIDDDRNTLWIAQNAPTLDTTEEPATPTHPVIDEIFNEPVPGYARSVSWWFEILNNEETWEFNPVSAEGTQNPTFYSIIRTINSDGEYAYINFMEPEGNEELRDRSSGFVLQPGERGIVCADRAVFEAMTGGAPNAKWILEAKSFGTIDDGTPKAYRLFDLHPDAGELYFTGEGGRVFETISWSRTGAPGAVDISTILPGQSIRRSPTGTGDFVIENFPLPGDKWRDNRKEWLKVTTVAHESTLGVASGIAATTLTIQQGTTGWPESGSGLLEHEAFSYTGRTLDTLTGVTGLAAAHVQGAPAWPTVNGEAMTGWLCSQIKLWRPSGGDYISRAQVYVSQQAVTREYSDDEDDNEEDAVWKSDYAAPIAIENDAGDTEIIVDLTGLAAPWVRTVLVVIDYMENPATESHARAKINEMTLVLDAATINESGVADLGSSQAAEIVDYIIETYNPLGAQLVVKRSLPTGWGVIGRVALAIAPLHRVLADLAVKHGMVLHWHPGGYVEQVTNPWWPDSRPGESWSYAFTRESLRDEIILSDAMLTFTGLTLSCQATDGTLLTPETVLLSGAANNSSIRYLADHTVADQAAAGALAQALLWHAVGETKQAIFTVKGIGAGIEPLQRFYLVWGAYDYGQYIAQRVVTSWGPGRWQTQVEGISYDIPT